jgi:predicted transcriptional regulator
VLPEDAMATTSTTTLKLPSDLKTRLARVAKKTGRTPHAFMLEAIERQTTYEEHMEAFVKEALAAGRAIEETGPTSIRVSTPRCAVDTRRSSRRFPTPTGVCSKPPPGPAAGFRAR